MTEDIIYTVSVFVGTFLACVALWVHGKRHPNLLDMGQKSLLASNFSFFATLYTFFLGFAVVTLWGNYNEADNNLTKEAQRLQISYQLSYMLPDSAQLRTSIKDYMKYIVDEEWKQMLANKTLSPSPPPYERMWKAVRRMKPANPNDNIYHIELINRMIEVSSCRHTRLDQAEGHLYPLIWLLIYLGLFFSVLSFYFLKLEHNSADIYFISSTITLILFLIFMIYELDSPYSGWLHLKPDQLVHALSNIDANP